jgi:argininosuccinate lyase
MNSILTATGHALSGLTFSEEKAQARLTPELFATHLANRFVAEGLPFRDAYRKAAEMLADLEIPDKQDITGSYSHVGSIADGVAEGYGKRIEEASTMLTTKKKAWDDCIQTLIT